MTSEGPHRPGQEPDEVSPDAGGPAPYGDRTAHQDQGYGTAAAPDLGWAPPPPAGRPDRPAPAWAQSEQPAAGAWGAAQVPQQAEPAQPGQWDAQSAVQQPAWMQQQEQPAAWGTAATTDGEAAHPGWAQQAEQPGPAWAQQQEQPGPAWAQQAEGSARGAAQVPGQSGRPHEAWGAQDDPARSGGWDAGGASAQEGAAGSTDWQSAPAAQQDDPARSVGWAAAAPATAQDEDGGWRTGPTQDEPGRPGGWETGDAGRQADQPAWARQAGQAAPAWAAAPEAGARGAAQVPGQGDRGPDDPAGSGGWNTAAPAQEDFAPATGWSTAGQQDDAARSGGWATAAAQQDEPAQSGGWDTHDRAASDGWGGAAPAQHDDQRQGQDWPIRDESSTSGGWAAASVPQRDDRPGTPGWASAEPGSAPARATASVPAPDGPPAWAAAGENPPPWTATDRPVVPDAEPWAPGEAWGKADAEPAGNGWEPNREDSPVYQPAPAPGISPANAVPLPPQEQRVPGASLAAAPPADFGPPSQYAPVGEQSAYAEQSARESAPQAYEPEQHGGGWGPVESRHEEPQSPAGPVVPSPRTSPESGLSGRASVPLPEAAESAAGSVSASASVPLASRVMPPTDQALRPGGASPTPQPRVYGRAARPEPVDEPGQDDHQHDQGQQPRFDDHDRSPGAPHGFGEPPSVTSAPPVSPGMPPAYPPGVPSFMEPAGNNRPVNGVRPHSGADRPADPFGGPPDPFGGPPDPFGTPGGPAAGGAPVNGATPGYGPAAGYGPAPGYGPAAGYGPATPGYGPSPMGEQARGGFPPAFPQAGQQSGTSWDAQPEQGRFDSFKPDAEPKVEQPAPKVRNGRVLAAVLVTAVLILAIPLGLLSLLGKFGGNHKPPAFDPAVGSCVRQSGAGAVAANCGEAGAFSVVSKVDAREKCADPAQPAVVLQGDLANRVLCLKPAGQ